MWLPLVARIAVQLFHLTMCFFGVRWHTRCHRLQLVQLCCWISWYIGIWCFGFNRAAKLAYCSFDCLITHAIFLMLSMTHIFVLLDTFVQRRGYCDLLQLEEKEQQLPQHQRHHVGIVLCSVLVPNITMQCVVSWCRIRMDHMWNMSFFWVVIPASLGIQLKLYSFLWIILQANVQIVSLREQLKLLARNSKQRWRQPAANAESVLQLKQRYSQLSQQFALINVCYGNSLLIIFMHYFFNFTFNAFWTVKNLLVNPGNTIMILLHSGVLFNLGLLFTVICWHCQQSYNHSRQIGCLIPKLVKPLGDKRYNDLICDFLLQTLHKRFVVTARDFFSLNLRLLTSMCAAVVTYLVIMMEFMYADNSTTESKLKDMKSMGRN